MRGMKASNGAIDQVRIHPDTREITLRTVGNAKPKGLCGSGIVDAVAEMLKAGIIDEMGIMHQESSPSRVRSDGQGQNAYILVREQDAPEEMW